MAWVEMLVLGAMTLMEAIQIDAAINSGNSGGALCNIKGQVIGVTSSKLVGDGVESMGFAIPIDTVNSIISDLESGKKIERPYVGVQVADINNSFGLQYYSNIKIGSDVKFGAIIESLIPCGRLLFLLFFSLNMDKDLS